MHEHEAECLRHSADYKPGLQPSLCGPAGTWGFTPGWYQSAPSALFAVAFCLLLAGCNSAPAPTKPAANPTENAYTARPTIPPPPIKLFHQDNDTYTLVTKPDATDAEIAAILWEFRDAAHARTFAALHLDQKFIDARKPSVWFHVYRGPKCAAEKYTKGPLPCDASYHGAGDYTLGAYNNPGWDDAILHHADGTETHLWNSEAPYTTSPTKP